MRAASTQTTPLAPNSELISILANYALPQRSENSVLATILLDVVSAVLAFALADTVLGFAFSDTSGLHGLLAAFALTSLTTCVAFFSLSLYNPERSFPLREELARAALAIILAQLTLAGGLALAIGFISLDMMVLMALIMLTNTVVWRTTAFAASLLRVHAGTARPQRLLIVGNNHAGKALARLAHNDSAANKTVVGLVGERVASSANYPIFETSSLNLLKLVSEEQIDEIVVVLSADEWRNQEHLVRALHNAPVPTFILPHHVRLTDKLVNSATWSGIPFVPLFSMPTGSYMRLLKRTVDVMGAIAALFAVLPVISLVAMMVALSSRGNILAGERRLGQHGHVFTLFSFRTADAEGKTTALGRFLRQTNLDQLPQLLNLLRGDLSLIGPHPEPLTALEQTEASRFGQYLRVPQGVIDA